MPKSLSALIAIVALVAGCVAISGPTAAPSVTPRPASPTPSASPTTPPTLAPTATPAPTGTAQPTATAGLTPQPTGSVGFDQRDVVFFDDLADSTNHCTTGPVASPPVFPVDCWGTGTTAGGTVGYANGQLRFDTTAAGAWMWSRRLANSSHATMRVVADLYPVGDGRFGAMCAASDDELFGAVVGTDGSWAFVTVSNGAAEELSSDHTAGLDVQTENLMAVECAGTATGPMRLTLWLGKSGEVASYTQADGPANFDRAATYVESSSEGFSVGVDNLILFGSGISDGSFSPEGQVLLTHVPAAWQSSCYQGLVPPYMATTAEAVVMCFPPTHDGAEIAEYAQFATTDSMNAAYQSRVDNFGTGDGVSSCNDGSGEHSYNFGTGTADVGRLLCVDQFNGIRLDWTDTRLNILGTLIDFDGSYGATFTDWQAGGPDL